jgi:oxygen-dependent protoporphyrinogen oxidase
MSDNKKITLDCAIVGGGISGLTAVHALHTMVPDWKIRLFEKSDRFGGILETRTGNGLLIETSADSFITDPPAALQLCERLGLEKDVLPTQPTGRRAEVLFQGRLRSIPDGFQIVGTRRLLPVVCSPLLSWKGKLRACCEPFIAPRTETNDESLAAFATRRLGKETFERLIAPLVGGIYTADAEKLSMAAALPRFVQMERSFGSLYRGLRSQAKKTRGSNSGSGARYGLFAAPRGGMGQLLTKLAQSVPTDTLQTGAEITNLTRTSDAQWQLEVNGTALWTARKIILATPAFQAGKLLEPHDTILAGELRHIPYASCAVVCLVYDKKQFPQPPESFGFVVPAREKRQILAASFASNKFPLRAPEDQLLVRVFMGGATQESILEYQDAKLAEIAASELSQIMDIRNLPHFHCVTRWPRSMPQYHVGHVERIARIDLQVARLENLALIGNAYRGVGIPQCIDGALRAAELLCGEKKS